ncbi:MAG: hypothetical protein ABII76_05900 [Pseudomonadota bacterium]
MSILARHQLLDDLSGPALKPATARRAMQREPITIGTLMRHRYAGIFFVAAYVLTEIVYFYVRYWG